MDWNQAKCRMIFLLQNSLERLSSSQRTACESLWKNKRMPLYFTSTYWFFAQAEIFCCPQTNVSDSFMLTKVNNSTPESG